MIFKEKKFVYTNERKLVWLFVKKIEHQTIKMYVWKKDCKNKKDNKKNEMFKVSIFLFEEKKKCNAAEVGRSSRIYSCLLSSCLHER